MNDATRRGFLTVAGTTAAVGAVVALAPSANAAEDTSLPAGAAGAMTAHIYDLQKGEVVVMTEGREVIVTDKVLVSRLARAFARAARS